MEIQLIDSEKFYITQQDKCLYDSNLGTYNDIEIKSIDCPEFYTDVDNDDEYILFLRGLWLGRDLDNIQIPQEMMKQVLTALSLCCIDKGVALTIKL